MRTKEQILKELDNAKDDEFMDAYLELRLEIELDKRDILQNIWRCLQR